MINQCKNCKHWNATVYDYGKCSEINSKLEIELITGWDGGCVDYIETESDFGCNLFVKQEEADNV